MFKKYGLNTYVNVLNIMEWAYLNNCPFDMAVSKYAANCYYLNIFNWLVSKGCPFSLSDYCTIINGKFAQYKFNLGLKIKYEYGNYYYHNKHIINNINKFLVNFLVKFLVLGCCCYVVIQHKNILYD